MLLYPQFHLQLLCEGGNGPAGMHEIVLVAQRGPAGCAQLPGQLLHLSCFGGQAGLAGHLLLLPQVPAPVSASCCRQLLAMGDVTVAHVHLQASIWPMSVCGHLLLVFAVCSGNGSE